MNIKKHLLLFFLCFVSITPILAQRDHIDISNYILCINQEKYSKHHPRLLVLLGNSALLLRDEYRELWGGYSYRIMFGRKLYRLTRSLYMQATDCKSRLYTTLSTGRSIQLGSFIL